MDQVQGDSHEEFHANLFSLPIELLVYIISFLSSLRDRVKLRYTSRWLRCVIEETPSLWKEFVWPYYDSCEECSVKEVLKMCGRHVKMLSFPYCRVPSTLIEMLKYCSNVQHLSLPSTKLDPEQLQKIIHHMGCLQSLELKVDNDKDIKQLLHNANHLKEITIMSDCMIHCENLFKYWKVKEFRPPSFNVIAVAACIECLVDYAANLSTIPTGTTANFTVFDKCHKVPLNFSPSLPFLQLHVKGSADSGQVTTPFVKLSDSGILGLKDDLAVLTDSKCTRGTMYGVRTKAYFSEPKLMHIAKPFNLNCATHFDLSFCNSLHSGHLEQLAIACPNLQRLNLQDCNHCLKSLKGLRAIASHCQNLQGLNLVGIHVSVMENHVLLWEILSDMKLTHLAADVSVLLSKKTAIKQKLICLLQKCSSIKGIECDYVRYCCCDCCDCDKLDMLSYFTSLQYFYLTCYIDSPTITLDIVNNCKELKYVRIAAMSVSLNLKHNHNLQQLCIQAPFDDVPDYFMTSVSAHGGLVHVVMDVRSLTAEGITSLVRNSPKLMTLWLYAARLTVSMKNFNAKLKKMFSRRRLFTAGYCNINENRNFLSYVLQEQGTNLVPLWGYIIA